MPEVDGVERDRGRTGVRVRRAEAGDVDALVELRTEMFRAMGTANASASEWQVEARRWFSDRLTSPEYGVFVVDAGDRVVACAVGTIRDAAPSPAVPAGRDVLIHTVCTDPAHRGRGHGRRAFEAVLAWARSTGVGRAELMATEQGRGIYEQAGFVETAFPAMRLSL